MAGMSKEPTWMTAADAAHVLKCSARQVHRYGETGQLVTRRAGRRVLFSAESVARLADELQVDYRPPPPPSRDLAPMIDAVQRLDTRQQEWIEAQRSIDERLARIEQRLDQPPPQRPNWIGLAALVLAVIALIVVLVVVLRLL
jgi:hypothetical protein